MSQTVTLALPEPLYTRLQERASRSSRSVEEETLDVLATAVPATPEDLLRPLREMLSQFEDTALWSAARSTFDAADRVSELHEVRSERGLSGDERKELDGLLARADRVMLVRAQAAVLLKERGHDISVLLGP